MMNEIEIMDKGMSCLVRELGIVEAEIFIVNLKKERFDYTKWRQDQFDDMTLEELNQAAVEYAKAHPFKKKNVVV